MSLPIKRKELEDPPMQCADKKLKSAWNHPLPLDIWEKIFHCLIPQNAFGPLRASCSHFWYFTLPWIHSYLAGKEKLTAQEILQLRLPLSQLLIYQAKPFQDCRQQTQREVKPLWEDFSIPELCSYILFHCTNLQTLDLRHDRYQIRTFLGEPFPFNPYEVPTQSSDDPVSSMETKEIIEPMRDIFSQTYPIGKQLMQMKTLIVDFEKPLACVPLWPQCQACFPHLQHIEIYKGKIALQELKEALAPIPTIRKCTLRNCELEIREISDFFLSPACPDIFLDGGKIRGTRTKYSLKAQNQLSFIS